MSKSWFGGSQAGMLKEWDVLGGETPTEFLAKKEAERQNAELQRLATPAPTPDDPVARAAMDDAAAQQRRARSRSATILSGANSPQGIGPGVGTISRRMLLGA